MTVPRPSSTNFQSENALSRSIFRAVTLKCWSWCLECYNLALTAESQSRRHSSSLVFMNFKNRFKYARNSLFLRSMTTSNYRSFNTASLSISISIEYTPRKPIRSVTTSSPEAHTVSPKWRSKINRNADNAAWFSLIELRLPLKPNKTVLPRQYLSLPNLNSSKG